MAGQASASVQFSLRPRVSKVGAVVGAVAAVVFSSSVSSLIQILVIRFSFVTSMFQRILAPLHWRTLSFTQFAPNRSIEESK